MSIRGSEQPCGKAEPHRGHLLPTDGWGSSPIRCPGVPEPVPTVEEVTDLEVRLSVATNAVGSELYGHDGRPLDALGAVILSDQEVTVAKRIAVRVIRDLAELDLAKADERLATTGEWITRARDHLKRGQHLAAQRVILEGLAAERGIPAD